MAKKAKRIEPDEDGYIDLGFGYKKYVGPPEDANEGEARRILESEYKDVTTRLERAVERFRNPQPIDDWLDHLHESLLEYIGDWISFDQVLGEQEVHAKLSSPDGRGEFLQGEYFYRIRDGLPEFAFYTLIENAPPFVEASIECLCQIEGLRRLCSMDSPNLPVITQNAFMLGRDIERALLLPNAPLVGERESQLSGLRIFNETRVNSDTLKQQALDAIERAKRECPSRADDIDFIKERAAESLSISKRALNKRLKG